MWITVGTVESFTETPRQFLDVNELHIAICKIGEEFYAFESLCTHAMVELDDAPIENATITCPLHGARFSLKTGEVLSPPAYEPLRLFPTQIQNQNICILIQP